MATNWNTTGVFFFGFSKLNCLFGFSSRKVSHRNGIRRWLRFWQSCRLLRWTTGKIFQWTFEIFNYSCSSTAATKWNIAAIKILLLFDLVCICGLRSSSPRNRRCRGFESHLDEYAISMRNYSAGLYQNRISNNFRKTADLKKNVNCKLKLHSKVLYQQGFGTVSVLKFLQTLVLCKWNLSCFLNFKLLSRSNTCGS